MPVKGCLFHRAQTVVQGVTTVTGEEHLSEVMEGNRYPDTSGRTASKPSTAAEPTGQLKSLKQRAFVPLCGTTD